MTFSGVNKIVFFFLCKGFRVKPSHFNYSYLKESIGTIYSVDGKGV